MKKLGFALLAMLLIVSCSQAQSQNDFYGKWVTQIDADPDVSAKIGREVGGGTMEWDISGKTFTAVWTPSWVTYVSPVEQTVYEIFSWERIKNDNKDTMKDYPNGYLLGLRHGLGNTTSKLFMHCDKNSIISTYEDRDGYHQEVYYKPCLQSDFYGTWVTVDDEGKKYEYDDAEYAITDNNFTKTRKYEGISTQTINDKILSWEIIINKDDDTKSNYPIGFIITRYINSYNLRTEWYLHKNKKYLLEISDINNSRYKIFFKKIK